MSEWIRLERVSNARDLGGMTGADGRRSRPGRLIRSGHLAEATEADVEWLRARVSAVVDLRTTMERTQQPDRVWDGGEHIDLPILEALTPGVTHETDAEEALRSMLEVDENEAAAYMQATYRRLAGDETAQRQFARLIDLMLEPRKGALLWHCTAGKDRAGFAAAIIETLLGVSEADVRADYLYTNVCNKGQVDRLVAMFAKPGERGGEAALRRMFGADETYLDALMDTACRLCGSFDRYLTEALGATEEKRQALRALYLE